MRLLQRSIKVHATEGNAHAAMERAFMNRPDADGGDTQPVPGGYGWYLWQEETRDATA